MRPESDSFMPEYWPANKLIGILEGVLIDAENIIGQLTSEQIKNLAASKIIGQLTDEQLEEISAAKVAGQLTSAQIEALEAVKITGQLASTQIAANAVTAEKIVAEAITAAKIAAATITGAKIAAGTITAEKLSVEKLSAITADLGTLTAGIITGVTIESSFLRLLELATESGEALNSIRWLNGEAIGQEIYGIGGGATKVHDLYLRSKGSKGTGGSAQVLIRASDEVSLNKPKVEASAGGSTVIITEEGGKSSFLQLTGVAKRKVAFGKINVKYPGGSPNFETKAVAHGLGVVPSFIMAVGTNGYTNVAVSQLPSATQFSVEGGRMDGFTGLSEEQPVWWIAIG